MRKIALIKYLIYIIGGICLFLTPTRYAPSDEIEKSQYQQTPEMKGYTSNLKKLLEETEQNLQKVNEDIKKEEKEAEIREHIEKGNRLYQEGKFKEAKQEWQKALEISKDPQMRDYIKKAESRAREEELARKKEEQKLQKKLEAEAKERERQESELKKQQERLAREQKIKETAEVKERERLEKEKQRQLKLEQKEQARKLKEEKKLPEKGKELAQQKKEQREKERLEADKKRQEELARKKKANSLYEEATSLYNQGLLDKSAALFKQILSLDPTHRKALDYIENKIPNRIEAKQKEQERKLKKEKAAEEKRLKEEQKRLETEKSKSEQEKPKSEAKEKERLTVEKKRQEELARKGTERKQREEQARLEKEKREKELAQKRELEKKIDSLYKEATTYYKNNQFDQAKDTFGKILSLDPNQRKAKDYLENKIPNRIRQVEIAKQREEERNQITEQKLSEKQIQEKQELKKRSKPEVKAEPNAKVNETARAIYKEAVALYGSGEYTQAKVKFEQIKQIEPNYPNIDYYLEQIPQKITAHKERSEAERKKKEELAKRKKIASLSNEAVSSYDEGKLAEATALFKQILSLDPINRKANYYLEYKLPSDVAKLTTEPKQEREESLKAEKERAEYERKRKETEINLKKIAESVQKEKERQESELKKQQERLAREQKIKETAEVKERERLEKEKQRQLELKKKEEERQKRLTVEQQKEKKFEVKTKEKGQQETKLKKQQKQLEKEQVKQINSLYREAVSLYNHGQLDEAKVLFFEILSLDPTERKALDYIENKIPNRIKQKK